MFDAQNSNSAFKVTTTGPEKMTAERKTNEIVLGLLVAAIASGLIAGCAASSELFVFAHPVYPTGLNATEIGQYRAREAERRQFEYEQLGQDSSARLDRDGTAGPGIPLLTWRFGGGSSRPDLAKRYALHKDNLWDSSTSSTDVAQVLSRNERRLWLDH